MRDDEILLARHVKDSRTSFLLPGGGIEEHESAAEALTRELREEAGVRAQIGDLRYAVEVCSPDRSRHLVQLVFEARIQGEIGASTDPRVERCEWRHISELRSLVVHPAIGRMLADDLESGALAPCRYVLAPWTE